MNENARIYICTHTDFDCPVSNPVYEIADSRQFFSDDKADNGIDALFYSELLTYHHLAKQPDKLPDIVGFCGYRKYFSFLDDVPDLEALVRKHGRIATTPAPTQNERLSPVFPPFLVCRHGRDGGHHTLPGAVAMAVVPADARGQHPLHLQYVHHAA